MQLIKKDHASGCLIQSHKALGVCFKCKNESFQVNSNETEILESFHLSKMKIHFYIWCKIFSGVTRDKIQSYANSGPISRSYFDALVYQVVMQGGNISSDNYLLFRYKMLLACSFRDLGSFATRCTRNFGNLSNTFSFENFYNVVATWKNIRMSFAINESHWWFRNKSRSVIFEQYIEFLSKLTLKKSRFFSA